MDRPQEPATTRAPETTLSSRPVSAKTTAEELASLIGPTAQQKCCVSLIPSKKGPALIRIIIPKGIEEDLHSKLVSPSPPSTKRELLSCLRDIEYKFQRHTDRDSPQIAQLEISQRWEETLTKSLLGQGDESTARNRRMIQRLFTSIDAKAQAPWLSTNLRLEVLNEEGIPLLKFGKEPHQHIEALARDAEDLIQQYRAFSLFRASAGRNPEGSIAQAEKGLKTFQKLHEFLADGFSVRKAAQHLNITIGVAHKLAQGETPAASFSCEVSLCELSR